LLIATVGVTSTFWATAAALALSALVVLAIRIPGGGRPPAHARPRGLWTSTREGFAFLWGDRVLCTVALLSAVLVALWLPVEGVVLPYHYSTQHEPGALGLLVTVMSGGGVIGALLSTAVATRVRRRTTFVVALLGVSIPLLGMALLPPYPIMLALGFAMGLFFGPINPITNIAMWERTPAALRGRVVGAIGAAATRPDLWATCSQDRSSRASAYAPRSSLSEPCSHSHAPLARRCPPCAASTTPLWYVTRPNPTRPQPTRSTTARSQRGEPRPRS
jgi:hypothetical protein